MKPKEMAGACMLFIRHAKRYRITGLQDHGDVLLTGKGKHDAFLFGRKIKQYHKKVIVFHSPVKRCGQTAEYMGKGFNDGENCIIEEQPVLWGGKISKRPDVLAQYFSKHGNRRFLRDWFNSNFPDDIIIPYEDIAQKEMKLIIEQLETFKDFIINVTHDWNILTILEYYFHIRFEKAGMPKYLDGISVYREKNTLWLRYKQYECQYPIG